MRLALLTEIPAPFRIPLFNALADRVDLRVFFLAERDPRRPHYRVYSGEMRFDHRVLPGWELARGGAWIVVTRGVRRALGEFDPDALIVGGWNQPAMWSALTLRRPTLVWVESTLGDQRGGSRLAGALKRAFLRRSAGAIVPGVASRDYVRALGVADERIHVAPNAVDTAIFDVERRPHDGCAFLYVGRLDPEKDVDVLLRAFADVPGELRIVGSGTEEPRLRAMGGDRVRFLGRLERDDLPEVYAAADALVLPSRSEPWGMVLNEAATAGLALVATDAVGAAHDLIEEGRNGYLVRTGDERALAEALRRLALDDRKRLEFGARSRELARRFTPEAWADAAVGAAASARSRADHQQVDGVR